MATCYADILEPEVELETEAPFITDELPEDYSYADEYGDPWDDYDQAFDDEFDGSEYAFEYDEF